MLVYAFGINLDSIMIWKCYKGGSSTRLHNGCKKWNRIEDNG